MQATRPIDQANLLNACFHSVFAPPDHGSTLNYLHQLNYCVQHKLCELKLSVDNILKQLKLLDINKASLGLPTKLTLCLPLSCYNGVLRNFHPLYVDYLIWLWS